MAQGTDHERRAGKILEAQGYVVHRAVRSSFMSGGMWMSAGNDIFNAFDLIATKYGEKVMFIQVTTNKASHVPDRVIKVNGVPLDPAHTVVEVWGWVGGRRRLDKRHKKEKVWIDAQYYWVYGLDGKRIRKERVEKC